MCSPACCTVASGWFLQLTCTCGRDNAGPGCWLATSGRRQGMSKHAVRACLIVNPRSGGGGVDLSEALHVLAANHWQVAIREKLRKGYAVKLAREAAHEEFDVVVACGGDGTVSEVVDGLAGTGVAVGTLPA